MAGGGGSTGGIGAQSPAVNPPSPMGQIGNAVGGALGGMGGQPQTPMGSAQQQMLQTGQFGSQPVPLAGALGGMGGQPQNPMGGGNLIQTGEFGSPIDTGGFAYFGDGLERGQQNPNMTYGQPQGPMGGMAPDYATSFPMPRGFGQTPQQGPFMGGVSAPNSPGQAPFDPSMMGGEGFTPGFGQQQQPAGLGGLAALLGGRPTSPPPAVSPAPTTKPSPVATKPTPPAPTRPTPPAPTRPAPVAAKPVAKPSVVPSKTPPAVASAIQKLAAKKPFGRR